MREEAHIRINSRTRLWKEASGICPYCKKTVPLEKASLDHIIPIDVLDESLGESNLIFCCKRCNKMKGNQIIFTNLVDREIYPIVEHTYIYQDYYIHSSKKLKAR